MRSLLLLLMLSGSVQAQTQLAPLNFYQVCFGGLDNYHDSARIDNCDFQDMQNVLTDRGFLEKRPGSVCIFDSVLSGYPIKNLKEYITNANRKYMLIHSSQTIYSTDLLTTVAIATTNVNAIMDSVSGFDKHFIVDGYDPAIYYDGTSTYTIANMPICKYVEFANERILCGNVSGAASTIYTSEFGDYTNWTIPVLESADAPTAWSFDQQDGKPLTGMFQTPFGLLAFKRTKTFIIRGVDNDDYEKRRISNNIGCVDDRSIQLVNGCPQWLGVEGVYKWCGGSGAPELVSREIDTTIKAIRNIASNADVVTLTSKADFDNGRFSINGELNGFSTTIIPNSIIPSSWTAIDTLSTDFAGGTLVQISTSNANFTNSLVLDGERFNDGNYTSSPTWTISGSYAVINGRLALTGVYAFVETPFNLLYGTMEFDYYRSASDENTNFGVLSAYIVYLNNSVGDVTQLRDSESNIICNISGKQPAGTIWKYVISISANNIFSITNPNGSCSGSGLAPTTPTTFRWTITSSPAGNFSSIDNILGGVYVGTGTYTSKWFNIGLSTPTGGPFVYGDYAPAGSTVTYSVRASTDSTGGDSPSWTVVTSPISGTFRIPFTKQYWQYKADMSTSYSTQTVVLSSVTLTAISTGTWDSEVLALGSLITSWGQFSAITDTNDRLLFYTRASTMTYTKDASTPTWTLQGNGYNITCDTGTFLQARVVSTVGSSTDTAQVASITLNWYEGESAQVASLFWDGRYYVSVSTGSSATTNNTVLVQQRTDKWTLFNNVSWSTLGIYDNYPYAGDGLTTSKIWRIIEEENYFDDNTLPINAYAITKDFQFDGQNNSKIFRNLYLESSADVANTMSVGYSVDKSTSYTTTTQAIGTTTYNDEVKQLFPGFAKGRYLRLKFSNNNIYEPLMLNGYTLIGAIEQFYRK